jgi:hypothetical protein
LWAATPAKNASAVSHSGTISNSAIVYRWAAILTENAASFAAVTVLYSQPPNYTISIFAALKEKAASFSVGVDNGAHHNIRVIRVYAANSYALSVRVKVIVALARIDAGPYLDNVAILCCVNRILNHPERLRRCSAARTIGAIGIYKYYLAQTACRNE